MSGPQRLHGWKLFAATILAAAQFFLPTRSDSEEHSDLPNLDNRTRLTDFELRQNPDRQKALAHLTELVPDAKVDFETVAGSPKWISAPQGFLSGPHGVGISPEAGRGIAPGDVH